MFILKLRNRHFFVIDFVILLAVPTVALILRRDTMVIPERHWISLIVYTLVALAIRLYTFYRFGLYSRYWLYASVEELVRIGTAVVASTAVIVALFLISTLIYPIAFARSVILIDSLLILIAVGAVRFSVRFAGNRRPSYAPNSRRALIMGAGGSGEVVARELLKTPELQTIPVGFIDDDPQKHNVYIHGLPVLGSRQQIPKLVADENADLLILAIPSASGEVIREITGTCELINIETKIVPAMNQILGGKISLDQLRDVDIEDLLRREPVRTDIKAVRSLVAGQRVLVTGGGGSIGSELCRQLLFCGPSELIILGHGENSMFEVTHELNRLGLKGPKITPIIADTRFQRRIKILFQEFRPDIVFHAAAHKHVPLMELNPAEAITNNIQGTQNLLEAAQEVGVQQFVMISTDKAVNPSSIMGASKRVAELLVHQAAQQSGRPYVTVRFGNVLGSRGSVILTFKKQIAAGGPVTVTDPEIKRYFMTIPEATQLVLQAAALGTGDEVFVLDMGEPVKILDLAEDMIKLSGYEVGRDIKIEFIGLRPGDKLYEELFIPGEDYRRTDHEKIFVATNASHFVPKDLDDAIFALSAAADRNDSEAINFTLRNLIPEYMASERLTETGESTPIVADNSQVGGTATSGVSA